MEVLANKAGAGASEPAETGEQGRNGRVRLDSVLALTSQLFLAKKKTKKQSESGDAQRRCYRPPSGVYESPSVKKDPNSRPIDLHGRHGKSCRALFLGLFPTQLLAGHPWRGLEHRHGLEQRHGQGSRLASGEAGAC